MTFLKFMVKKPFCFFISVFLLVISPLARAEASKSEPIRPTGFVQADGQRLVDGDGQPLILKGIGFANGVWMPDQSSPPWYHHGEADIRRAAEMGFNCLRFGLNYKQFESDASPGTWIESGFAWLDTNIDWAREQGIGLILLMTVPQGGFQSNFEGDALWQVKANQNRLVALWTEIARRYADEPTVYGYALLNEPVVKNGINQWKTLSSRILASIRKVDQNHLVIVECLHGDESRGADSGNPNQNGKMNFSILDDKNVMYEFHFYQPIWFTHQNANWMDELKDAIGPVWPDRGRVATAETIGSAQAFQDSAKIAPGNSEWTRFESKPFALSDAALNVGRIALKGNNIGSGTVWYDDVSVTELDSKGATVRVWNWNFNFDDKLFWWASSNQGKGGRALGEGRGGSNCWKISGSGTEAFLFEPRYLIAVRPGYTYAVSGWMRGEKVASGAAACVWLGFNKINKSKVYPWDREYLEAEIGQYLAFGEKHKVPVFMGEFGVIDQTFIEDRGGLRWVEDVMDICIEKGLPYAFHEWHGLQFGLYAQDVWVQANEAYVNKGLIDLFTRKQAP